MRGFRQRWQRGVSGLLAAVICLAAVAASYAETLVPHTARYKIKISIASGTLETTVRETNEGFAVQSLLRPTGLARMLLNGSIEERSEFTLDDGGVRPHVFASTDTLSRDDKNMDFVFDWERMEVSGRVNDDPYHFELEGEAHDRVSIQYQLMHNLVTASDNKRYALLEGDELKKLDIKTTEPRIIKVPFGNFEAIGVSTQAVGSKRITTLWCAEELGYLPVLIEQHRKGKRLVRAVLTDYSKSAPNSALPASHE